MLFCLMMMNFLNAFLHYENTVLIVGKMFGEMDRIGSWVYDMETLGFNYRITDFSSCWYKSVKKARYYKARRREIVEDYYNGKFSILMNLSYHLKIKMLIAIFTCILSS